MIETSQGHFPLFHIMFKFLKLGLTDSVSNAFRRSGKTPQPNLPLSIDCLIDSGKYNKAWVVEWFS